MATAPATIPDAPPINVDVRYFSGAYLVWRLNKKGFRRNVGGRALPYVRHGTLVAATAEATRLTREFPGCTFVVIQEVARAKAASPAVVGSERTDGGWVEWAGGECPVNDSALVNVRLRAGSALTRDIPAGQLVWLHGCVACRDSEIVAYKVVA